MIDLEEERAFWEFVAEQNSVVQHKPNGNKLAGEYRFATFKDDATKGERAELGSPRLEMMDTPTGTFNTNDGGYQWDTMQRTIRIIRTYGKMDMPDKLNAQNVCKEALAEIVRYIQQQQEEGDLCSSHIIKLFQVNTVAYQLIEAAASDGSYAGCLMRINLRAPMGSAAVNYGTFSYPPES